MDTIKILIVEDELIVSEEIKELLLARDYEVIGQAISGEEALEIIEQEVPDLILMDINIKGKIDGIELAEKILSLHSCGIIFLTAFEDDYFLNRAKRIKPAAYLVKPFDEKNLVSAIEIAFNNILHSEQSSEKSNSNGNESGHIFIRNNSRFDKVLIKDILFIKAEGSYSEVQCENKSYTLSSNLKSSQSNLSHPQFLRVHRSYLVNLDRVDAFEGNMIYIGKHTIPISEGYKEEFLKKMKSL